MKLVCSNLVWNALEGSALQVDVYSEFRRGLLPHADLTETLKILEGTKTRISFNLESSWNTFNKIRTRKRTSVCLNLVPKSIEATISCIFDNFTDNLVNLKSVFGQ
jgi:hypothetical protein